MKKIFSLVLVLVLTLSIFSELTVFAVEKEGLAFTNPSGLYKLETAPNKNPITFEAEIYFPKNTPGGNRGGVIFGNFGSEDRCTNLEIYTNGNPRLYWVSPEGTVLNIVFSKVNVYNGAWTHLTVVADINADKARCYVNGELIQTLAFKDASEVVCPKSFVVGGDFRSGNAQYFKGRIKFLAVYSDIRTESEIKSDMTSLDKSDLIVAYDFKNITEEPNKLIDLSDNKNNAKFKTTWMKTVESDFQSAFSFAVIGDTQLVARDHPTDFPKIYDYILDNLESKNIKMVLGLGDITDKNSTAEWNLAKANILKLNNKVPYSLARGNHDGSANFNSTFMNTGYKEMLGGTYNAKLENSWQELIVGDLKYLIITLDYGPDDSVLNWASKIIEAHPKHNVIITTHAYLFRDGTTLDANDVCPPSTSGGVNNGDHIWEKLVSKHENIVLVLSGHDPCNEIIMTQTPGKNNHVVTQFLIDPQRVDTSRSATGMVAMFYFSEDGTKLRVEYYSTVKQRYFMEENQFETELDLVDIEKPTNSPIVNTSTNKPTSSPDLTPTAQNTTVTENPYKNGTVTAIVIGAVALCAVIMAVTIVVVLKKKKGKG